DIGTDFDMGQQAPVTAIFTQTGGAFQFSGSGFCGPSNSAGPSILNLSGGTFTSSNAPMYLGVRGPATLTISGTALVTLPNLQMGYPGINGTTKTANLDGGTLVVNSINNANPTGATSTLNFNGGTLRANSATTPLLSAAMTTMNVRNGGVVIDTNGNTVV